MKTREMFTQRQGTQLKPMTSLQENNEHSKVSDLFLGVTVETIHDRIFRVPVLKDPNPSLYFFIASVFS